jgi:MFS family permease
MDRVSWMTALGVTLLMQTVASFMGQCLPVVAPLLTAEAGVSSQSIGALSALTSFGTMLFLGFGGPLLARSGPVRMLQWGALLCAGSLLVCVSGRWPALLLAAVLLGIGYGPTPPAGSRVLAMTAPPRHRTLIFSIKQAGAPAGGALAGLLTAPVAGYYGWAAGLGVGVIVGVLAVLAVAPLRQRMDVERDPTRPIGPRALLGWHTLREPIASLGSDPLLLPLSLLGLSFSIVQGNLFSFTVTYLTTDRGLSLARAGLAYAGMQGAGVAARILLGWLADRTGAPVINLTVQAYAAVVLVAWFGCLPAGASFALIGGLAAAAGFVGASWNGVVLAEVARLAPLDKVAVATAGSTLLLFLGYVIGPAAFTLLVTATGGWRVPFLLTAGQLLVFAAAQTVWLRRHRGASLSRRGA